MKKFKIAFLIVVVSVLFLEARTQERTDFDYTQHGKNWPSTCIDPERIYFHIKCIINHPSFFPDKSLQINNLISLLISDPLLQLVCYLIQPSLSTHNLLKHLGLEKSIQRSLSKHITLSKQQKSESGHVLNIESMIRMDSRIQKFK